MFREASNDYERELARVSREALSSYGSHFAAAEINPKFCGFSDSTDGLVEMAIEFYDKGGIIDAIELRVMRNQQATTTPSELERWLHQTLPSVIGEEI